MREKEFLPFVAERLGIGELNEMQRRMLEAASQSRDIMLLSPTGSGKTLAFTLPMMKVLRPSTGRVQAVVIAPSRELVVQIAGVVREVARGFKVTALYGGHSADVGAEHHHLAGYHPGDTTHENPLVTHRIGKHRGRRDDGRPSGDFGQNIGEGVVPLIVGDEVDTYIDYMPLQQRTHHLGTLATVEVGHRQEHSPPAQAPYVGHAQRRQMDYDVTFQSRGAVGDAGAGADIRLVGIMDACCRALLRHHAETTLGQGVDSFGCQGETAVGLAGALRQP